jgi:hypothetical protein
MGEKMIQFIWYWKLGEKKVFTQNTAKAEKAMKDGLLVMGKMINTNVK